MCVNGDHRPPALPFPGPAPNSCRNKNGFLGCQVREALWYQTLLRDSTLVTLTKAETFLCVCMFMLGGCVHMGVAEEESGWES